MAHPFFSALYGREIGELANLVIWSKKYGSTWCPDEESASATSSQLHQSTDIYFGVCLQDPEAVRNRVLSTRGEAPASLQHFRGYAATAAVMPGLWLDIDIASDAHKKKGLPTSREAALAFLEGFPFAPSVTVESGGGVHLYWLFTTPWILEDEEERGIAAALIRRWQERIRRAVDYTVDATHDLSRVLRAPGTTNHKYGTTVGCSDLEAFPRYEKDELIAFCEDDGQMAMVADPVIVDPPVKVEVSADAQPPTEKLLDLINLHPTFAATWRRERKDLPSQSEYDLSLATMAAKMAWSQEEIAALLMAHRKAGGEPLKLDRPGYYQRTIAKAMSENAQVIAHDRLTERVDSVASGETKIEHERLGIYTDISQMIGVHVIRIIRYIADPPQFRLVMEEGSIDLGGAENIVNSGKFRVAVAALSKHLITRITGKDWDPIAQAILRAAEDEDLGADSSPEGLVAEWLGEFLAQQRVEEDRAQAMVLRVPFLMSDGTTMIFLGGFQQWLSFYRNEKMGRRQLGILLRSAGCQPRAVAYRDSSGGQSTRNVWAVPERLLPLPPDVPSPVREEKKRHSEKRPNETI